MGVDAEAGQACRLNAQNPQLCDCVVNIAKRTLPDMRERQAFYHFILGRVQQGNQMYASLSPAGQGRIKVADDAVDVCKRFK
jgi:hypothetical protein